MGKKLGRCIFSLVHTAYLTLTANLYLFIIIIPLLPHFSRYLGQNCLMLHLP